MREISDEANERAWKAIEQAQAGEREFVALRARHERLRKAAEAYLKKSWNNGGYTVGHTNLADDLQDALEEDGK